MTSGDQPEKPVIEFTCHGYHGSVVADTEGHHD